VSKVRGEGGFTLIEMVMVMVIMTIVMTGVTTLFVQGSNAEVDMNQRFQTQLHARLALDRLRRDVHCASAATVAATTATLTTSCDASGTIKWCTATAGGRTSLYRQKGATACSSASNKFADYLVSSATYFAFQSQNTSTLAKLYVCIPVNVTPARTVDAYALKDVLVMRNTQRTGSVTTATFPSTCPG
jgi:prepilin-type N-terminal cleavage/methylation domain-containing protein